METLISLDMLIKELKKKGVDLGKGDPYNRLRYYTKIGWLPHMVRKKNIKNEIVGHYPSWVADTILEIERFRQKGLSNQDISRLMSKENKVKSVKSILFSQDIKNHLVAYMILILVIFVVLVELNLVPINKQVKSMGLSETQNLPQYIYSSGISFVAKGYTNSFVKTKMVSSNDKIYITFKNNYAPATRYWVSNIKDQDGFTVELDSPVAEKADFYWWVSK